MQGWFNIVKSINIMHHIHKFKEKAYERFLRCRKSIWGKTTPLLCCLLCSLSSRVLNPVRTAPKVLCKNPRAVQKYLRPDRRSLTIDICLWTLHSKHFANQANPLTLTGDGGHPLLKSLGSYLGEQGELVRNCGHLAHVPYAISEHWADSSQGHTGP